MTILYDNGEFFLRKVFSYKPGGEFCETMHIISHLFNTQ